MNVSPRACSPRSLSRCRESVGFLEFEKATCVWAGRRRSGKRSTGTADVEVLMPSLEGDAVHDPPLCVSPGLHEKRSRAWGRDFCPDLLRSN